MNIIYIYLVTFITNWAYYFYFSDKVVPKTCENFKALCTHKKGYGYIESKFHHIVSGFGLYGGKDLTF